MRSRRELGAIAVGGAAGALLRVWLGETVSTGGPGGWPWVTFAINVSGAFLLAYVATSLDHRPRLAGWLGPLLGIGFCGAYTTFSTMQVEALRLVEAGRLATALGYLAASLATGYTAVAAASALARRVHPVAPVAHP